MRLDTNEDYSFNEAFPAIIEFINKVGYDYKDGKLYDVGNKILFVTESNMAKEKYSNIVEKLYEKKYGYLRGKKNSSLLLFHNIRLKHFISSYNK